jgi:hypothetical protein
MRFLAQASVARITQSDRRERPSCNALKRGHCFSARHLTRIDFRPDSSAISLTAASLTAAAGTPQDRQRRVFMALIHYAAPALGQ